MEAFGQYVRVLRQSRGLTQKELAQQSGIALVTLCKIEQGRIRRPYRRTLTSLACGLGISLSFLIAPPPTVTPSFSALAMLYDIMDWENKSASEVVEAAIEVYYDIALSERG